MEKVGIKVLLIHMAPYKVTGVPIGLASICSVLKQNGHHVKIFDDVFYNLKNEIWVDQRRSDKKMSKKVEHEAGFFEDKKDIFTDIFNIINEYQPDIIGISLLESFFSTGISFLISPGG